MEIAKKEVWILAGMKEKPKKKEEIEEVWKMCPEFLSAVDSQEIASGEERSNQGKPFN